MNRNPDWKSRNGKLEVLSTARGALGPAAACPLMQARGLGFVVNAASLEVWDAASGTTQLLEKGKKLVHGACVVREGEGVVGWFGKAIGAWTAKPKGGFKPLAVKTSYRLIGGVFEIPGTEWVVSIGIDAGPEATRWSSITGRVEKRWSIGDSGAGVVVGRSLVVAAGTALEVYDALDGTPRSRIDIRGYADLFAPLPNGHLAAGRRISNKVVVVDLEAGKVARELDLIGKEAKRLDAAWDLPLLGAATEAYDPAKRYQVWNYESGELMCHFAHAPETPGSRPAPVVIPFAKTPEGARLHQLRLAPRGGYVLGSHPTSIGLYASDGSLLDVLEHDLSIGPANLVRAHSHIDPSNRAFVLVEGADLGASPRPGTTVGGFLRIR